MGIVFWLLLIFIVFLIVKIVLYIFKVKIDVLPKDEKLWKLISIIKNLTSSLSTHLSTHHLIPLTSLTIYVYYEYYEKSCFELTCFISENEISATKLVKKEVVVAIVVIVG
jgi:hypothetical protein